MASKISPSSLHHHHHHPHDSITITIPPSSLLHPHNPIIHSHNSITPSPAHPNLTITFPGSVKEIPIQRYAPHHPTIMVPTSQIILQVLIQPSPPVIHQYCIRKARCSVYQHKNMPLPRNYLETINRPHTATKYTDCVYS